MGVWTRLRTGAVGTDGPEGQGQARARPRCFAPRDRGQNSSFPGSSVVTELSHKAQIKAGSVSMVTGGPRHHTVVVLFP